MKLFLSGLFIFILGSKVIGQKNEVQDILLIQKSRAESNQFLEKHDIIGFAHYFEEGYVGVWGNGGHNIGKDSSMANIKKQLDLNPYLTYVRTPEKVIISDTDTLAIENGQWIAFKTVEKKKWVGGNYSAMWHKVNGVWLIRSELYVTLRHY